MNDFQRIAAVLKIVKLSARAFAIKIGLKSPQIFYDIKAGKCGISKELAAKIHENYVNINVSWLLTGEGEMLSTPQTVNTISGDHNVGNGTGNTVNSENTVQELFNQLKAKDAIISKSQAQLDKSQEQIDRLIALLEKREER